MNIPSIINTSNIKKQLEFLRIFNGYNIPVTFYSKDIKEIVGTPLEVIVHKASVVGENVLVEDTSLDIEGHDVGIHVKHLMDLVTDPEMAGVKAVWTSMMAFAQEGKVYVFEGIVKGAIAPKAGDFDFGFAQWFMPEGMHQTMGQLRDDNFNARAICVKNVIERRVAHVLSVMTTFDGYEMQQ